MGDGGRANECRASFSYWLKTPLSNQTWPRVCSDTNWLWKKEGAFEFCVETLRLADAYENGDKHRKSGRLQKQNNAANARHKARDKQQRKHRQKKTVGLRLMDGGPLKINPPNSHPSNPIHKAVIKAQKKEAPLSPSTSSPPDPAPTTTSQDINKTLIAVGAHLFTGLLVWTRLIPKFLNCPSVLT